MSWLLSDVAARENLDACEPRVACWHDKEFPGLESMPIPSQASLRQAGAEFVAGARDCRGHDALFMRRGGATTCPAPPLPPRPTRSFSHLVVLIVRRSLQSPVHMMTRPVAPLTPRRGASNEPREKWTTRGEKGKGVAGLFETAHVLNKIYRKCAIQFAKTILSSSFSVFSLGPRLQADPKAVIGELSCVTNPSPAIQGEIQFEFQAAEGELSGQDRGASSTTPRPNTIRIDRKTEGFWKTGGELGGGTGRKGRGQKRVAGGAV